MEKITYFIFPWNTIINKPDRQQYTLWDIVCKSLEDSVRNSEDLDKALHFIHSNKIHKNMVSMFLDNYYTGLKRRKQTPMFDREYLFSRVFQIIIAGVMFMDKLFARSECIHILHTSGTIALTKLQTVSLLAGSLFGIINFYSDEQNNTLNLMRIFKSNNIQLFESLMIFFDQTFIDISDVYRLFADEVNGKHPMWSSAGDIVIRKTAKQFRESEWKSAHIYIENINIIPNPRGESLGTIAHNSLLHLIPSYNNQLLEDTFQIQPNISVRKDEMLFVYYPELLTAMMLCSQLSGDDAIIVMGARCYQADVVDYPRASDGTIITSILLADPTEFGNTFSEYTTDFTRDLNKLDAMLGYIADPQQQPTLSLAASDWGYMHSCNKHLKFLQIVLAAAKNGMILNYIVDNPADSQLFGYIAKKLRENEVTVSDIFTVYKKISESINDDAVNGSKFKEYNIWQEILREVS